MASEVPQGVSANSKLDPEMSCKPRNKIALLCNGTASLRCCQWIVLFAKGRFLVRAGRRVNPYGCAIKQRASKLGAAQTRHCNLFSTLYIPYVVRIWELISDARHGSHLDELCALQRHCLCIRCVPNRNAQKMCERPSHSKRVRLPMLVSWSRSSLPLHMTAAVSKYSSKPSTKCKPNDIIIFLKSIINPLHYLSGS